MNILIYIVATLAGLFLSYVGVVFAMLSGRQFAYIIGGLLAVAHIGTFVFVRRKAIQGKGREFAFVLALPIFIVLAAVQVFVLGRYVLLHAWPDSPEFTAECQTAGARYFKLPASPARSIAYEWPNRYGNSQNYFTVSFDTRIDHLDRRDPPYPAVIEFTEYSYMVNRHVASPRKFIRKPRQGEAYSISALSTDILVGYEVAPAEELKKAAGDQGMVKYELTVTDRRDGEKLASLKYVVDAKNRRACGLTGNSVMDERAFVLKAVGIQ